jgi:hypothetical protein
VRFVDQPALRRQRADLGLIRSLTAERYGQFGASCDTPAASTTAALLPTKSKITRAPRLLVRFITRQHEFGIGHKHRIVSGLPRQLRSPLNRTIADDACWRQQAQEPAWRTTAASPSAMPATPPPASHNAAVFVPED